ncbi:MAG: esterase family protein [Pseudomonadales bacterium]|nr:esterase family protein [Pseudomonadales bacterium]
MYPVLNSRRQALKRMAFGSGILASHGAWGLGIEDFKRLGLDQDFPAERVVNGRSNFELLDALRVPGDAQYHPCKEAYVDDSVPQGKTVSLEAWRSTGHYQATTRDILLYTPSNTAGPLPVIVFNDGLLYADPEGPVRTTVVMDNLIHAGEIPAMAAVFVMPGRVTGDPDAGEGVDSDPRDRAQRSFEYDSLTPIYGEFLIEEVLPLAASELGVTLSDNPDERAICGISSGGICAFNTAWHHPNQFRKVISHCGSFVNIRGGHNYPFLIRSNERKPIRTYLTSGISDGNITFGSWPLANKQMAASLDYAGYDYHFEFGEGGHSLFHGGALFAETLRWLWRG